MKRILGMTAVVLVLLCALRTVSGSTDGQNTPCLSGGVCFPGGKMPDDVSPKSSSYFCCLEKNTTRHTVNQSDGSKGCECKPDFSLDEKIQSWANSTMNEGRMCSHGAVCENERDKSTINYRFKYCCPRVGYNNSYTKITIFDGDKEEYNGCRCVGLSLPTLSSNVYAVPSAQQYSSSGESCLYNEACNEKPAALCNSSSVTFCCYGSRGIFTSNKGAGSLTQCTCTNEFYGAQCEAFPVPIEHTTMPCLTECDNVKDKDNVNDDQSSSKCCPYNMVISAEQPLGNPTSCYCKVGTSSSVSPSGSLFHVIIATIAVWHWSRLGLM